MPDTVTDDPANAVGGTIEVIVGSGSGTERNSSALVAASVPCRSVAMTPCSVTSSNAGIPGKPKVQGAGPPATQPPSPNESASNKLGAVGSSGQGRKHNEPAPGPSGNVDCAGGKPR